MIADGELRTEHRLFLSLECALAQGTTFAVSSRVVDFGVNSLGYLAILARVFLKKIDAHDVPEGNQPSRTSSHCSSTFTIWVIESFDGYMVTLPLVIPVCVISIFSFIPFRVRLEQAIEQLKMKLREEK